jgi:Uma2 family endonuclease
MPDSVDRPASYEDVLRAPDNMVAELIGGQLILMPRPAIPHAAAGSALQELLGPPFKRGLGGPGGWIIVYEPEVHLGDDVLVPDLAGWRRTTLEFLPAAAYLETRPDWACEILSPSTQRIDRELKLPIYARFGVGHVWLVDPIARTLEVWRREAREGPDVMAQVCCYSADERVRAEPFDAIELELAILWADVRL